MRTHTFRNLWKHLLGLFLVCALIFSFGLHALQIRHDHVLALSQTHTHGEDEETNTVSISAYLHVAEKKSLFILFLPMLWAGMWLHERRNAFSPQYARILLLRIKMQCIERFCLFNFLVYIFKRGLLHVKIY